MGNKKKALTVQGQAQVESLVVVLKCQCPNCKSEVVTSEEVDINFQSAKAAVIAESSCLECGAELLIQTGIQWNIAPATVGA